MSRVFRKTALGIATFTKKETGLTASQRALLIMVDGKRSAGDLRRFSATFGDVNALLRELYDAGFIELDSAYIEKLKTVQSEIAQEAAVLGMSFGPETVVAPVPSKGVTPVAQRDLRNASKQDLRDFSLRASSDAPLKKSVEPLALAPIDSDGNGDELSIASVSPDTLRDAKDFAKHYVFEALGNSGTALCQALDRTEDLKSFMHTAGVARETLGNMKGVRVAADFRRQLHEILLR